MDSFVLIPLFAAAINQVLAIFVLMRNPQSTLSRVYFFWGTSIAVWNIGTFFLFRVQSSADALFWARFVQCGVIYLPFGLFHLSLLTANIRFPTVIRLAYLVMAGFQVLNLGGWVIRDVRYVDVLGAYYAIGHWAFYVFSGVYLMLTVMTLTLLYLKQKLLPSLHRTRLRALLLATVILFVFGNNDILPILGVYQYPLLNVNVYPYGSLAAIFYGLIVTYSTLQHQFLDIHVTLGRVAAQLIRLLFIALVSFVLLFIVSLLVPGQYSPFVIFSSLAVFIITALLASVLFPRFFGKGTERIERRLLGDRFEYHDRVRNLIQVMSTHPEPRQLLGDLRELLVNTMRLRSYQIILLDEMTRGFTLFHSYPERLNTALPGLHFESPIFQLFRTRRLDYLACKIAYAMPGETGLEREARQQLKQFDPDFCFPFFAGDDPFGLLLLGPKTTEEPYTQEDLRLLSELVQNLCLILNQIRLENQVQMAQEQELLGRMSRGLAHDLNNLLTPAQTLLQLFKIDTPDREMIDELLPVALRNLETVRSYVKEALFFSNTHSLHVRPVRLDETIRAAVELMQPAAQRKGVGIDIHGLTAATVEMDEVLVQRMLGNLISNAIDASPVNTAVRVELTRLPRTESSRDWYRLQIIDRGEGISPENLKRVFMPYFTTKDLGDGRRGFGLGLSIARKIMHLHHGNLNITSEVQQGTTVRVDLPSRQTDRANQKYTPGLREAVVA